MRPLVWCFEELGGTCGSFVRTHRQTGPYRRVFYGAFAVAFDFAALSSPTLPMKNTLTA